MATFSARTSLLSNSVYAVRLVARVSRSEVAGDCTCTTRPHSINRISVANVRLIGAPFSALPLLLWRIVLENLGHRVGDVLVSLLRLRLHVDAFLGGHA